MAPYVPRKSETVTDVEADSGEEMGSGLVDPSKESGKQVAMYIVPFAEYRALLDKLDALREAHELHVREDGRLVLCGVCDAAIAQEQADA